MMERDFTTIHTDEQSQREISGAIERDRRMYLSAIKGSLVGGAVGDALGYPVEYINRGSIVQRYGEGGIRRYEKNRRTGTAIISDDTQMTLFTAVGMLAGFTRGEMRGIMGPVESYIHMAYRDWYKCQYIPSTPDEDGRWPNGEMNLSWISYVPEMHEHRAPGNTCMSALRHTDYGTIEDPINNSKGCGGIMRIAPIPLYYRQVKTKDVLKDICFVAAKASALTHGHSLGYMPSAALAQIISRCAFGGCPYEDGLHGILKECIEIMKELFEGDGYLPKMIELLEKAEELAGNDKSDEDNIYVLGEGWVAEETLAISLYCCLRYPDDFSKAVIASVNHSGDSDSTGAVAGNIMGAYLGYEKIDPMWLEDLEVRDLIEEIATDLCDRCRMSEYSKYVDHEWERKYIQFGKGNR